MTNNAPRLLALQQSRNFQSRDAWDDFVQHRQQAMHLLRPKSDRPAGNICLWGAGNCNDVDLAVLCQQYARIDLVDWDAVALSDGVRRQLGDDDEHAVLHGGVDVTTIAATLSECRQLPPDEPLLSEMCRRAALGTIPLGIGPADTSASLCLLSQLVELCSLTLGADHPRLIDLVTAVRLGHLRQLAGSLGPGGKGILVSDLVSSDTAPGLAEVSPTELPPYLHRLLANGNFFTGLHPQSILQVFREDSELRRRVEDCQVTSPWRWKLGPRTYAVYAVVFQGKSTVAPPPPSRS